KGIDDKGAAAFVRAVSATNPAITSPLSDLRLEPISKSRLDELIRFAYTPEVLSEQLLLHYVNQIADRYVAQLAPNLRNEASTRRGTSGCWISSYEMMLCGRISSR